MADCRSANIVTAIAVLINIVTACLASRTAEKRGRSMKAWLWLGIVFGPFAWLTMALLPCVGEERTA